jgi:hypothetical protein
MEPTDILGTIPRCADPNLFGRPNGIVLGQGKVLLRRTAATRTPCRGGPPHTRLGRST